MCSTLCNSIFGDDDDLIRTFDRGKTMSDGDRCAVFGKFFQAFLDLRSLSLSNALVASSRIRIGGFFRKTRAMEIRCFGRRKVGHRVHRQRFHIDVEIP